MQIALVPTKKLSRNNGSSISPQIAAVGNNVYVVWSDNSTGNGDIYFKRSMDNGDNFRRIENLSKDQTRSSAPDINVLGKSNVYIVWVDTNLNKKTILFRASGDNGTRFDKVVSLTKDVLFSSSYDVVANKNDLFLVWMGDRSIVEDRKVYFKRISEDFFDRNP